MPHHRANRKWLRKSARIDDNGAGNGQAVSESFNYDAINRLIQYQVAGPAIAGLARSVTLHYNALGAMLDKTDVGVYRYPASGTNSVTPHALAAVNGVNYSYDANGNLISATGGKYRSISYTSFNLPDNQSGAAGPGNSPRYTWQYDADHQRVKETHSDAAGTRTTWTLHPDNANSLAYENELAADGTQTNRHYLSAGGIPIGILVTNGDPHSGTAATIVKTEYWHRDHLGSIAVTTDATGTVTHRYAYDPFGKRRPPDGNYDSLGTIIGDYPNGTDRGFTGHEHLDDIGIVHMNGRLYDPNTGRFLQADPYIQSPGNLQSYQRYSYILNNPLNATDPSGMFSIKGHIGNLLTGNLSGLNADGRAALHNPYVRIAAAIAVAYFTGYADYGSYGVGVFGASANAGVAATSWAGFANAAAAGFAGGYVATGTLKGGLNGLYTGVLFFGAGSIGAQLGAGFASGQAGAVGLHAVAGCLSSEISGGECKDGALSAAFSEAASPYIKGDQFQRVALHATVGGTASAIGGGKFANGAFTGAFGYIFNECGHTRMCGSDSTSVRVMGNRVVGDLAHVEIEISSGYDFTVLEARPGSNGRLVDTSNGPNWGSAFSYELVPPAGETTASIGLKLQAAASLYKNDLWYSIPSAQYSFGRVMDYGYNSNSYVGGLIERALPGSGIRWGIQATAQASGFRVPGMEKPIPLGGPR